MRLIWTTGLLALGLAGTAEAGLEICNNTSLEQTVAIGYKGDTDWTSEGWWNIAPGACSTLVDGDLQFDQADAQMNGILTWAVRELELDSEKGKRARHSTA